MRAHSRITAFLLATFAVALFGACARAQYLPPSHERDRARVGSAAIVESWYEQYLHRSADVAGLQNWVSVLREGASPLEVQAGILGSEEYWQNHYRDPGRLIAGLYKDVLGRRAWPSEIEQWLRIYRRDSGDRQLLAQQFLTAAQGPP